MYVWLYSEVVLDFRFGHWKCPKRKSKTTSEYKHTILSNFEEGLLRDDEALILEYVARDQSRRGEYKEE